MIDAGRRVTILVDQVISMGVTFEAFVGTAGARLRASLIAAYGSEAGNEATAEALSYGWEHWDRLSQMENPAGYLYRVGQTAARRARKRQGFLPSPTAVDLPDFEPGLVPALESLTEPQRVSVLLIHAFGYTQAEAAEVLDIDRSSVRIHLRRAMSKLRAVLKVEPHVR